MEWRNKCSDDLKILQRKFEGGKEKGKKTIRTSQFDLIGIDEKKSSNNILYNIDYD